MTILEQGAQPGGALQTFVREGVRFDTGFHAVGGMDPGGPLRKIFEPFGLNYLPWEKAGEDECIEGGPFMRLSSGTSDEYKHVAEPYIGSTWRLKGGGKTLIDALVKTQDIRLNKKVVSIEDREVICSDTSTFRSDIIVSAIHPRVTFSLLKDHVRSSYIKRLNKLEDGPGAVTLNCKLRQGMLPWIDHDIFIQDKVMIHFGDPDADGYARSVDLLGFAPITPEEIKEIAATRIPDLPFSIAKYWVSTPETWERYTGTPGGTADGGTDFCFGYCFAAADDVAVSRITSYSTGFFFCAHIQIDGWAFHHSPHTTARLHNIFAVILDTIQGKVTGCWCL